LHEHAYFSKRRFPAIAIKILCIIYNRQWPLTNAPPEKSATTRRRPVARDASRPAVARPVSVSSDARRASVAIPRQEGA
jgi:hypothetical protein